MLQAPYPRNLLASWMCNATNAQPYAYWTGTFVLYNAITRQLRCSHDSHKGHCPHVEAVNAFAGDNALDGLDDEEQDFAQVCCCIDICRCACGVVSMQALAQATILVASAS